MFKFAFFFLIPFLSISTVGLTACQSSSPTALVTQSANPRSPQSSASPGLPSPTPTNTFSAGPHPFSASLFQDNTDLVKPCEEGQCLFQQAQKDQCSPQTQNLFGKGLTPLNPVISCYYNGIKENSPLSAFYQKNSTTNPSKAPFSKIWYYIVLPTEIKRVGSQTEFKSIFAPVESPSEAVAFAMAFQVFDGQTETINASHTNQIREEKIYQTQAYKDKNDYIVENILLRANSCADSNERQSFIANYRVSVDGEVTETKRQAISLNNNACPLD